MQIDENKYEEPEENPDEKSDYPIDSFLIRQESRSVFEIVRRIKSGQYLTIPDYQRDFVWDQKKQSKLIESTLLRIPLPVFYLAEKIDGTTAIVDGLQRLTTFEQYLNNEFKLIGLEHRPELNGKFFKDLSPIFQNRIEDTNLIIYLIDSKVPPKAQLDIFERVNSGEPLTRQQMRNCIYVGSATQWLREQVKTEVFQKATGQSINPKTMRDREIVNRFAGFYIFGIEKYKGDMDSFLAETLDHLNTLFENPKEQEKLSSIFKISMELNYKVFGQFTFRKRIEGENRKNPINVALFDVFSILFTKIQKDKISGREESLRKIFYQLMENQEFVNTITISTNSTKNITTRFKIVEEAYKEYL